MEQDVHAIWHSIRGEAELRPGVSGNKVYWEKTVLVDFNEDVAVIEVPNVFIKRQFETRFNTILRELLTKNGVQSRIIDFVIPSGSKKPKISRETTAPYVYPESHTVTETPVIPGSNRDFTQPTTISSASPASAYQQKTTPHLPSAPRANLNPRYTLDSFIVGSSNDLAYSASQAVAANPGTKYNPLYFYGGVGLGKTHLMQAIGNEILKKSPETRILYVSSETFVKEFLDHIRFKKKDFSDKYRNVDVLIVDDMQFIANKEKTQDEFFHTFNALHQNNKQIIISSDKPPKSIPTLTERLRSRFEMGMTIDIQMPDFETRCAIISAKAGLSNTNLEPEVVEYLATNIKTNIRELEGVLNQLLAYSELHGTEPSIGLAEGLIGQARRSRPQHISSKDIINKTAKHFQLKVEEICSSKRDKHIVTPRQVAMYLLRSELHLSFPKIAGELGRKDHTTAIHSVDKIEKGMKFDATLRQQVESIKEALYV